MACGHRDNPIEVWLMTRRNLNNHTFGNFVGVKLDQPLLQRKRGARRSFTDNQHFDA